MKRGTSNHSLIIGINKPTGMSSHDVVNKVRSAFGEKRVGHTGTLDPMASGVLPVCVGPAARLDKYLVGHDKKYRATIAFGSETNTDDSEGMVVAHSNVPAEAFDETFAKLTLVGMVGKMKQVPPAYSAIKINGKPAYKLAREGKDVEVAAREVEVYSATLVEIASTEDGELTWVVDFAVSKGTYIRTLAHDLGRLLGTHAHLDALLRLRAGRIALDDCVSLDSLNNLKEEAALDPVRVLGYRLLFADDFASSVLNGNAISPEYATLYNALGEEDEFTRCACTSTINESREPLAFNEKICVIVENRLKAIYSYDARAGVLKPDCVFSIGVLRG